MFHGWRRLVTCKKEGQTCSEWVSSEGTCCDGLTCYEETTCIANNQVLLKDAKTYSKSMDLNVTKGKDALEVFLEQFLYFAGGNYTHVEECITYIEQDTVLFNHIEAISKAMSTVDPFALASNVRKINTLIFEQTNGKCGKDESSRRLNAAGIITGPVSGKLPKEQLLAINSRLLESHEHLANNNFTMVKSDDSNRTKVYLNGIDFTTMFEPFEDYRKSIEHTNNVNGSSFNRTNVWRSLGRKMALINAQVYYSIPKVTEDKTVLPIVIGIVLGSIALLIMSILTGKWCMKRKQSK